AQCGLGHGLSESSRSITPWHTIIRDDASVNKLVHSRKAMLNELNIRRHLRDFLWVRRGVDVHLRLVNGINFLMPRGINISFHLRPRPSAEKNTSCTKTTSVTCYFPASHTRDAKLDK